MIGPHLDPGPRSYLRQSLAYLRRHADLGQFPTLRPWHPQITLHIVNGHGLPTQCSMTA